jgi:hypothetical protein
MGFLSPKGYEDVAWWTSNRPRWEQQLQLGMIGPMGLIAGSIQPTALVEDLSDLSDMAPLHAFGAVAWGFGAPLPGQAPIFEIHAPAFTPPDPPVDVFLHALYVNSNTGVAHYSLRTVAPSPATDLAVITATATELDDGWGPYAQSHRARVFSGFAAPGPAFVQGTVLDAHGMSIRETESWNPRHTGGLGLKIPRGKNLVVDTRLYQGNRGLLYSFGCIIREAQAPGGPA